MNYNIRRRERNDCKDISNVVTIAWNERYKGIVSDDYLNSLYENEEKRATSSFEGFNDNNNHQFVLEVNDKIVGFIYVGEADDDDYLNCGEIYALYIKKEYTGYGFGRELVEVGINELKDMGFNKMIIGCLDGNPSNLFYRHLGGEYVKTRVFEKLNLPENVYLFDLKDMDKS